MTSATLPPATIPTLLGELRGYFQKGETRPLTWRVQRLERLRSLIRENEEQILSALASDLGKPRFEAYVSEIAVVLAEIEHTLKTPAALGSTGEGFNPSP